jgi:hypothetical protein
VVAADAHADPDQDALRAVLSGDQAPTGVVAVLPLDSWHIDSDRRLSDLLVERYRLLLPRCGGPLIWVRDDLLRARPRLDCAPGG